MIQLGDPQENHSTVTPSPRRCQENLHIRRQSIGNPKLSFFCELGGFCPKTGSRNESEAHHVQLRQLCLCGSLGDGNNHGLVA